jgi:hypothetical protein
MELVELRDEAATEAGRLASARRFAVDGDRGALAQLEGDGTWIAIARRRRIRQALGSRLLLVWRLAFEDAGGALVESCLVPVAVDFSRLVNGRHRHRSIQANVQELEPQIRAQLDAAANDWRQAAECVTRVLTSARTARERALAGRPAAAGSHAFQPGLFDRRAERAQAQVVAAAADIESASADRRAALGRSSAIAPRAPQLLLVLAP